MEGKAMTRVVLKTIMPFLMIALVAAQATIPTPNIPTIPSLGLPPTAPALPGTGGAAQLPPGGTGQLPPGGGQFPPPGGVQLPPGGVQLPPGGVQLPPGGVQLPPGAAGMVGPPINPWDDVFGPLVPGDLIPPFIPGIGVISFPKRQCAGKCARQCMLKRRGFTGKMCAAGCRIKCGIGK